MQTYHHLMIFILIVLVALTGCIGLESNAAVRATQTETPTLVPTSTDIPTLTAIPTSTQTPTPTNTPTPTWVPRGPGLVICPILLYHHIAVSPSDNKYYVSPDNFEVQMKLLYDWGYTTIPISLLVEAITNGAELPPRPVVITFDDGNIDVYNNAFPVMQKYGFEGVLYIVSNRLEVDGFMSADQIKEMVVAGWEVGSHSMSHADLTKSDKDSLYAEIKQSRYALEAALGVPVTTFAYPFGLKSDATVDYVHSARYEAAVGLGSTADQGKGNLFYLQRRPINGDYDLKTFTLFLPWTETPDATASPSS